MFGAPSIVSVVDPAAMITAIFIVEWLLGAVGGLSIGQVKDSVKRLFAGRNFLALPAPLPFHLPPYHLNLLQYLLVGQQALFHQYPPHGLTLKYHGSGKRHLVAYIQLLSLH